MDEAATLLARGATNIREIREAQVGHHAEPSDVRDWASNVHALQQRLLLRVPASDPVATTYQDVRDALIALDRTDGPGLEDAVRDFEQKRMAFLSAARTSVESAVS